MKTIQKIIMVGALVLALTINAVAQTNLQFTSVNVTDEKAIRLTWASQSNHVYQIQCANALATNVDGSTAWQVLYDDYPSQGTNTFWLDTGNYDLVPAISHPKNSPMRFYRILDKGQDDLVGDEPTVSIVSPTNGFVASGLLTVTVLASADKGNLYPKLYVDGQVMWPSEDGSNYVINTCEWGNESHTLFATVDSSTAVDGPITSSAFAGHGVSPFIGVTFSNLISRISFSQEFFQPSLGQTQQVSAVFAANCNWTLVIRDAFSNAVRTVTGSGNSLQYNWDGTGDGETNIPDGVYYYYISAQTNGLASVADDGSGDDGSGDGGDGGAPSPALAASSRSFGSTTLWAVPTDGSGGVVPLAMYPQGFDTSLLTIFPATQAEIDDLYSADTSSATAMDSGGGASPMDSGVDGYSGASSQNGPPTPLRKPTPPCKNTVGKIAIGYQLYNANGTNPIYASPIYNYSGIAGSYVQIYNTLGLGANASLPCPRFNNVDLTALNFADEMSKGCYDLSYLEHDDQLPISDLKGSGTFFNNADIGLLILHGGYGTSYDYITGRPLYGIYFPIASGTSAQYLRMTDMNLGGSSPTNGLKWMAILACDSLYQRNWNSMINQGAKPYNSNLHMILGCLTDVASDPLIGQYWADYMLGDPNPTNYRAPMTIRLAWYYAAYEAYKVGVANGVGNYPNPITLAVEADPNCINDTLQTNSLPSGGTWQNNSFQAYPPGNPPTQ